MKRTSLLTKKIIANRQCHLTDANHSSFFSLLLLVLGERIIPVQYTTEISGMATTGASSAPTSPNRDERSYVSSSATTTTTTTTTAMGTGTGTGTNLGPSIGENGSVFTLTNIYTFGGGDGNSLEQSSHRFINPTDFTDDSYEQRYRETHSSSMITRKVRTSATESYDYEGSTRGKEK